MVVRLTQLIARGAVCAKVNMEKINSRRKPGIDFFDANRRVRSAGDCPAREKPQAGSTGANS